MTEQFTLQFNQLGEALEVLKPSRIPIPKVQKGEVLIRVKASPINPIDLYYVKGHYGSINSFPATSGYEGAGIVEEIGEGVDPKLKGAHIHVITHPLKLWAEYAAVPASDLNVIPHDVKYEQAAQLYSNPITAYGLLDQLKVPKGEWLFVNAATSALGRILIQISKIRGFHIFAVVRKDEQVEELKKFGADIVISTQSQDLVAEIKKVNNDQGIKYAVDAIGGDATEQLIDNMAEGGSVVVYGILSGKLTFDVKVFSILRRNISVSGFAVSLWEKLIGADRKKEVYAEVLDWVVSKKLTLPFTPYDAKTQYIEAIKAAQGSGHIAKAVLVFK